MKKLFSFLAMMLLFAACQTEPGFDTNENGLVTARFSVGAHEISTRADETTATTGFSSALGAIDNFTDADWANYNLRFIFEVYAKDDNGSGDPIAKERQVQVVDKFANDDAVFFEVRLVPNKEYKFVVFADFVNNGTTAEDVTDLYYDTTDLKNITMIASDDKMKPMNEARDAYFITENRVIKTDIEAPLTLTRPFGKIRVVTTDYEHIAKYAAPAKAVVEYYNHEILKSFNAVNGQISTARQGDNELKFEYDLDKNKLYTKDRDSKSTDMTLFADYLLARPEGQSEVNFILSVYDGQGGLIKSNDFNLQIPIERNHLTTIEGNLLTTQTNIKVTINDDLAELTPIVWEEAVEEDVESWENGQVDTDGNYEFVVNGKTDSFLVTVNNEAVVNGKLTPGTYKLADKAAIDDKLTFTVKHNGTRAAEVNILNGHMIVEANEANEAEYTIDLNLHYEKVEGENKEEYKVSYNYTGEITIAEPLATPVVEAKVEGNVVTLTWAAVEGAAQYGITVGTEMPVFVEETTYTFTGEYETEYTFNVVAISEDNASEPATVTVTTEAAPAAEAYKLYFNNLANWTKVYAHIWANDGEDLGLESVEWPGRELTETEELDGVTYYVFQLPAVATGKTLNVVFNDGAGTQTKDLSGVVEGNLFFDNYVEPVEPTDVKLYLNTGSDWYNDNGGNVWFAAYFFGNAGNTWTKMTPVEGEDYLFETTIPEGDYTSVIFTMMYGDKNGLDWGSKKNQTVDIVLPTDGSNCYTIENPWDESQGWKAWGSWSVYTPVAAAPTALATPVVEAAVEGNVVTLTWTAIEGAKDYTTTYGDKQLVVEGTTAIFDAVVGTLTATVVANPADETKNTASEAGTVEVTFEAPVVEPEVLAELDADAYYIFKQATEMKGGKWYAIVYENKAATGLTSNYGYLKVTEAASRANGISLPATCAFGFMTTDGGYTIQQYNGKYVYQTGSYDSFNVNATLPTDGGVWSVAVNGNEYTITNNTMSKFVQYDPSYNSYGCYAASKGNLPTLYELVEVDNTPAILGVSTSKMSFAHEGGSNNVTVTTYGNATLNASVDAAWVSTSIAENVVTVNVEANAGDAREATLTITFGDDSRTITISQAKFQEAGEVTTYTDTLVSSMFKATSTTYTEFSGVAGTNGAVYAGKSAKSSNGGYIQLRSSKSEDGIVTTASGGKVKKIVVEWDETNTAAGRTLDIYVSNTAYTSATELYGTVVGEKIGNIVKGTSTELVIEGDYDYVGLRSNNGAMYIKSITITYEK